MSRRRALQRALALGQRCGRAVSWKDSLDGILFVNLPPPVQLADDRGCVTEYERNQTFLEIIIIGWILSIFVETLQRFKRRQLLATGMYGKGASLLSVLGIWDILDVLAVFFTLSACLAAACN